MLINKSNIEYLQIYIENQKITPLAMHVIAIILCHYTVKTKAIGRSPRLAYLVGLRFRHAALPSHLILERKYDMRSKIKKILGSHIHNYQWIHVQARNNFTGFFQISKLVKRNICRITLVCPFCKQRYFLHTILSVRRYLKYRRTWNNIIIINFMSQSTAISIL